MERPIAEHVLERPQPRPVPGVHSEGAQAPETTGPGGSAGTVLNWDFVQPAPAAPQAVASIEPTRGLQSSPQTSSAKPSAAHTGWIIQVGALEFPRHKRVEFQGRTQSCAHLG